jgi:Fe-S cluster assembly scaffold protein SufB
LNGDSIDTTYENRATRLSKAWAKLDEILNKTLDKMMEMTDVRSAGIYLLDEKNNDLVYVAHRGFSKNFLNGMKRIKLGEGVTGRVAHSGESVFKVVATGSAKVYNRGEIFGQNKDTKGHLECRGLMLCPTASITAIPELVAEHSDTELSHEAAIGKLQEEQLNYLMARGIAPDQAIGVLVKGFLDPGLPGLPEALQADIRNRLSLLERGGKSAAEPC